MMTLTAGVTRHPLRAGANSNGMLVERESRGREFDEKLSMRLFLRDKVRRVTRGGVVLKQIDHSPAAMLLNSGQFPNFASGTASTFTKSLLISCNRVKVPAAPTPKKRYFGLASAARKSNVADTLKLNA